jgi:hypothetical protein
MGGALAGNDVDQYRFCIIAVAATKATLPLSMRCG